MTGNQGDTSTQDRIRTYSKDENLVRERRKHIAYCAHKVFFEKGFKGTTMRQLAEACSMAPGALYRYIGSKSDILHLICINMSEAENNLEVILDGLGNVSATEALRQCIKFYFQGADATQDLIIFFNREIRNFSREDRRLLLDAQLRIV